MLTFLSLTASAWLDNMAATVLISADHHRSSPAILHGCSRNWVIGHMSAIKGNLRANRD